MAANFNEITLIGNLGADVKYTVYPSGSKQAVLSVCTEDIVHFSNGDTKKEKDWHRVVCWGTLAEQISELKKGCQVYVCGKLKNRQWLDDNNATQYIIEIVAREVMDTNEEPKDLEVVNNDFSENPYETNNPSRSITYS